LRNGETAPVNGFSSITLYNQHVFEPNAISRYSLGAKNRTLKLGPDGGLTILALLARCPRLPAQARGAGRNLDAARGSAGEPG
jgi:hypothetical protein